MLITKRFKFESAHKLTNYHGKCENLHGHSYLLEVTFKGEAKEDGMIMDFEYIKNIVNENIVKKLDHAYINELIPISTCENIAKWIWDNLKSYNPYKIKLYETEDSYVTYNGC
jgi:6-pyruvoyltetrahydropterin/6-carboxytetrahydropterin synthase